MRVIVIGAGVSGLTAARDLSVAGADVVVVDARDRIGGRTWTHDIGGVPVDLGGSWIHGPFGNPLSEEVTRAGLVTRNDGTWGTGMAVWVEGSGWAPPPVVATAVAVRTDFDFDEAVAGIGREGTYREGIDWYLTSRRLDGPSAEVARFSLEWLDAALNIGGLPYEVSLTGSAAYRLHAGGNSAIDGGYRKLVDHLAAGLDIRLGESVLAIEHGGPGDALASTTSGTLRADAVVVSVPLGVLKKRSITFSPEIAAHHAAADRLGMATLEKVVLRFDTPVFPEHTRRISFVSDDHRFPAWADMTHHAGAPTVIAFHNPRATDGMESWSPERRLDEACTVLAAMVGDLPEPVAAYVTDWSHDPHAFGSYSFVAVGSSPQDMRTLSRPSSDRLFFAGEHTVPEYFGTVHGAYVSGIRAAAEVMD